MVDKDKIIIGIITLLLLSSGVVYLTFLDDVRIRVDNDKTTFYTVNENNRWVVAGREYNSIFDGTSKMNRRATKITVNTTIEDNLITVIRETPYIRGPIIRDIYTFDGNVNDVELFPISHRVEITNGGGFFYRYEVRDLVYEGITEGLEVNEMSFGRNMKVTWQEGFRWARVFKSGILKVQYDIPSDFETYNVKLFDPEKEVVDISNSITLSQTIDSYKILSITGNESIYYNVSLKQIKSEWDVILTPKFKGNLTKNYSSTDIKTGKIVKEWSVTYIQPSQIRITEADDTTFFTSKNETIDKFEYRIPKDTTWLKLGEESILIVGDTTFNNTLDTNVTEETGFQHLNITTLPPYDDLLAYWTFDHDDGDVTAYDYTDNNQDGTFINGALHSSDSIFGDNSAFFDSATADYINTGDEIKAAHPFTICAWFKTSGTTVMTIFSTQVSGSNANMNRLILRGDLGGNSVQVQQQRAGSSSIATASLGFTDNVWGHACAIISGPGNRSVYFNGGNVGEQIENRRPVNEDISSIGRVNDPSFPEYMNGRIDEVMFFGKALTSDEVLAIYLNTSERFARIGNQTFEVNLSNAGGGGNEDTFNIQLQNYQNDLGTNISVMNSDGTENNLTINGSLEGITFTTNPNNVNVTLKYQSGPNFFFSPLLENNISMGSYTLDVGTATIRFTGEAGRLTGEAGRWTGNIILPIINKLYSSKIILYK